MKWHGILFQTPSIAITLALRQTILFSSKPISLIDNSNKIRIVRVFKDKEKTLKLYFNTLIYKTLCQN